MKSEVKVKKLRQNLRHADGSPTPAARLTDAKKPPWGGCGGGMGPMVLLPLRIQPVIHQLGDAVGIVPTIGHLVWRNPKSPATIGAVAHR